MTATGSERWPIRGRSDSVLECRSTANVPDGLDVVPARRLRLLRSGLNRTDGGACAMALIQESPEVFVAAGPISAIGEAELAIIRAAAKASPKRRARINAHRDSEDPLHEMIIAIDGRSYIRPHKHP